jgi:hypothetical protein
MTVEQIPSQLKMDTWAFHILARTGELVDRILNLGNLIANLKATMHIAELDDYRELLDHAEMGYRRAWHEYSGLKNTGLAAQTYTVVLAEVIPLVYDKRFATPQQDSFKGRSDK